MGNALVVQNGSKLANYGEREEVREMTDRLLALHPSANEVGKEGMRAVAQLAILINANPLAGTNEIHVWKDNGDVKVNLGINYYRRMAQENGGVLWDIQPRQMNDIERGEYGVPQGVIACICRGVSSNDMQKWMKQGLPPNQIFDLCGRVGTATVHQLMYKKDGTSYIKKDYAKNGRSIVWTALKRAEVDLYRQLFPVRMAQAAQHEKQVDDIKIEPAPQESLEDFNRSLYGDQVVDDEIERQNNIVDGEFTEPVAVPETPLLDYEGWVEKAEEAKSIDVFCLSMFKAFQTLPYSPFEEAAHVKTAVKILRDGKPTETDAMIKALEIYVDARANGEDHDTSHEAAFRTYQESKLAAPQDEAKQAELIPSETEPASAGAYEQ